MEDLRFIRCVLKFIYLLVAFLRSISALDIRNACEIHESTSNLGYNSPKQMLPQIADENWLFPTKIDIQKYYEIGKKECTEFMSSAKFDYDLPNPFEFGGQRKCRGVNMLHKVAGVLIWPFGPYKDCPTYSKCWFGLLYCGTPKLKELIDLSVPIMNDVMKKNGFSEKFPNHYVWSISALYVHARVIGHEIVVPQQRFWPVVDENNTTEDVLIGQYTLTLNHPARLELRLWELYPSRLYHSWSDQSLENGIETLGSVFLGGSEDRGTQANFCCGCDEKSFVTGTPAQIAVTDNSQMCPDLRKLPLPLCPIRSTGHPGRWMLSSSPAFAPRSCKINPKSILNLMIPPAFVNHKDKVLEHFNYKPAFLDWFEVSGDPCVVRNYDMEDGSEGTWFYAPYRCRYHVYRREQAHQCLRETNITHINFQGDSMSRDLFGIVSSYLGVKPISEDELKVMTNQLKKKKLSFHSGDVLLSEGYAWDFDRSALDIIHSPPLPQVVVTNYALAHRQSESFIKFIEQFNNTEYHFWKNELRNLAQRPRFLFFQNAKDLHGKKHAGWSADRIRRLSELMRRAYVDEMAFIEMDEWLITAGRVDNYGDRNDGWHFWGSMRQMESVIFINSLCNEWLVTSGNLHLIPNNAVYP